MGNYLFHKFINPIDRAIDGFNKSETKWADKLHKWVIQYPFDVTVLYAHNTSLGKFQKEVLVGMFIVYFKLYWGTPVKTEEEYNENPSALSYKHYLSGIVQSRLKKESKQFQI
jgi:translation elongation factor EF-G